MAAESPVDPIAQQTGQKKSKKKKKAKTTASHTNGVTVKSNGPDADASLDTDTGGEETDSPIVHSDANGGLPSNDTEPTAAFRKTEDPQESEKEDVAPVDISAQNAEAIETSPRDRLEAAAKQRDELRSEVTELRKSLESIQKRHEEEVASIRAELEETQSGKEHFEGRYQKLLGQVNTIKQQVDERLKADAEELSKVQSEVEKLEQDKATAKENSDKLEAEISSLTSTRDQQMEEIKNLRGRTNLSQQNWAKERDQLVSQEARLREEYEDAKQAMQDWEVLAMEERSQRENLTDRVSELEEQLSNVREAYERATSEKESQSTTVDGLQRALQDIQEARKQELREVVENSQSQIEELRNQLKTTEETSIAAQASLETTKQELERAAPFEKEVREKNLLIGKLRHEAVILNDHLTKALRFLKKGKPEDNVDRRLITNHLLHFLALDRSDPKKFQVLKLISALLGWTDEQKESAGLARPGTSSSYNPGNAVNSSSSGSLRLPMSPFRRVSSNASLSASNTAQSEATSAEPRSGLTSPTGSRNETLAELWSEFLEREAAEGGPDGHGQRRTNSRSGLMSPMSPRSMSSMALPGSQSNMSEEPADLGSGASGLDSMGGPDR